MYPFSTLKTNKLDNINSILSVSKHLYYFNYGFSLSKHLTFINVNNDSFNYSKRDFNPIISNSLVLWKNVKSKPFKWVVANIKRPLKRWNKRQHIISLSKAFKWKLRFRRFKKTAKPRIKYLSIKWNSFNFLTLNKNLVKIKSSKKWLKLLMLITKLSNNYLMLNKLLNILPTSFCLKILAKSSTILLNNTTCSLPVSSPFIDFWRVVALVFRFKKETKKRGPLSESAPHFYNNYLLNLLYKWLGSKVSMKVIPYKSSNIDIFKDLSAVNQAVYPALKRLHHRFFYKDLASAFTISLCQKNAYFLLLWTCRLMQRLPSKMHRKFLYYLGIFLLRISQLNYRPGSYLGIRFSISGKISVTGNAKTRTKHLMVGKTSLSSKELKLSFSQRQVRTLTGVLGIRCYIFY